MCRNEFPGSFVTVFCLSLQPPSGVFPRFPPAEHYGRGLDPARIRSVAGKAMSCQKEKKNSASFYLCFLLTFFAHKRKLTTTAVGQSLFDRKQRADCLQESVMLNEMTGKVSSVCHSHQIHTSHFAGHQLWRPEQSVACSADVLADFQGSAWHSAPLLLSSYISSNICFFCPHSLSFVQSSILHLWFYSFSDQPFTWLQGSSLTEFS